ncbi:hypothetical protein I6N95_03695 [Vagococcus sp. BWB3-3]|uniref:Uncharacterized protein n=1 Tax=Vagococcus allomyrinae TaxID=2794353 RepID=A0A940SV93_9ENTE|nr:hypothetical protein [Vagococcus allomyrinae]MBP1040108.1 hypothetical protein [Vagococcus allomyrinae]
MVRSELYGAYHYDDPDNEYTYSNSSVLRNKFNIKDSEKLTEREYQLVKMKSLDLFVSPIKVFSM